MQPKKAVKSSIHWHFWRNRLFLLTKNALLKRGPKNSGMGRPPPHHSGNARKKTFFFFHWGLPLYMCLSARRVNQLLHKGWVKPGQVLWLTSQWVAEPGKGETSSAGYQQKRFHHKICSGYQQKRLLQRHLQTDWQHAASFPQQAHPPPVFFYIFVLKLEEK